eukprot:TRINITY_DN4070_c0_g3_i2.p1 TRINITY_DN4070_c0_g3~~TRINITY_DN4070_c0_g3_i2.p1  ORF type:complete len:167 (+),score=18.64 TRINITY_DN4070_c0_g3_i2:96-596(+)
MVEIRSREVSVTMYFEVGATDSATRAHLSKFVDKWRIMFEPFRSKFMYWQAVSMWRRMLSVLCAVFLSLQPQMMVWSLFCVQFGALLLQVIARPYRQWILNVMDTCSLVALCLLTSLWMVLGDDPLAAPLVGVVLFVGFVILVVMYILSSRRLAQLIQWIRSRCQK